MTDSEVVAVGRWAKVKDSSGPRHQWYRPMTDEEVRDHSDGRLDGIDDFDESTDILGVDAPVYVVSYEHEQMTDTYNVTGGRTVFEPPRVGSTDSIGSEYRLKVETKEEVVETAQKWIADLS